LVLKVVATVEEHAATVFVIPRMWFEVRSSKGPNRIGVSSPHLKVETDPVSKMLCSPVIYNSV
jgi:hypothetical protein